jgi:hypothetical protein
MRIKVKTANNKKTQQIQVQQIGWNEKNHCQRSRGSVEAFWGIKFTTEPTPYFAL